MGEFVVCSFVARGDQLVAIGVDVESLSVANANETVPFVSLKRVASVRI